MINRRLEMDVKAEIVNIDDFIEKIKELKEYLEKAERLSDELKHFSFEIKKHSTK